MGLFSYLTTACARKRSVLSIRLKSTVSYPYCSTSNAEFVIADDDRLINRNDFRGVSAKNEKRENARLPETVLSRIQESLRRNYRVSASTVFIDVVKKLEEEDGSLVSTLRRSPNRWLPLLFRACGRAASNIPKTSRQQILARFWKQLNLKEILIDVPSINAMLCSMLENDLRFDSNEVLEDVECRR